MFEKAYDYLSKLFKTAYHTISKSFRVFFPLFFALLIIECLLFTVFLSFRNNISIRSEKITADYNYHVLISGLNEGEMLLLRNDDRTISRNAMCFDVIKTIRYESTAYDDTYTVYVKLLTGNKNYGILEPFIDDSLETNYTAMRLRYSDVFGMDERPNTRLSIYFTPLYTQEADENSLAILGYMCMFLISVASAMVFSFLYRIYLNHKSFVFGLYSTFGANARDLRIQALSELLLAATVLLLPAYYISSLLCYLMYSAGGSSFGFSFISLSSWLIILACVLCILFVAIFFSMKPISRAEPLKLISALENGNLVSSPKVSFDILKRKFPFGYEALSVLRFRRHHIRLAAVSSLLSVSFVLGFYFSSLYAGNASIRYRTDADFTLRFSNVSMLDEEYVSIFKQVKDIGEIYTTPDTASAEDYAALLTVSKQDVLSQSDIVTDKDKGISYTGDLCFYSGAFDTAQSIASVYTVTGNISAFDDNIYNVLIGDTVNNHSAFSFEVGDTVTLLVANLDDEGDVIYLDEKAEKIKDLSGRYFWKAAYENFSFRSITLNIVGVIEDYPSGVDGVPIVMHKEIFQNITGQAPVVNEMTVRMPENTKTDTFISTESALQAIASRLGNCSIDTEELSFENAVEPMYCYESLIRLCFCIFLVFIPLVWFYSQMLFFKKREKEFYILSAISAPLNKVRSIYLSGSIMMIPIAIASLLGSLVLCALVFFLSERYLPSVLQIGAAVTSTVEIPFYVYLIGIGVTLLSSVFSALIPYFSYKKRYFNEDTANRFYEQL